MLNLYKDNIKIKNRYLSSIKDYGTSRTVRQYLLYIYCSTGDTSVTTTVAAYSVCQ